MQRFAHQTFENCREREREREIIMLLVMKGVPREGNIIFRNVWHQKD